MSLKFPYTTPSILSKRYCYLFTEKIGNITCLNYGFPIPFYLRYLNFYIITLVLDWVFVLLFKDVILLEEISKNDLDAYSVLHRQWDSPHPSPLKVHTQIQPSIKPIIGFLLQPGWTEELLRPH